MTSDGPDERERWRVAFERCDEGSCCPANSKYHRPRCSRRAARREDQQRAGIRPERWEPKVEAISEIGGRRGCVWMFAAVALVIVLATTLSWWVVYR